MGQITFGSKESILTHQDLALPEEDADNLDSHSLLIYILQAKHGKNQSTEMGKICNLSKYIRRMFETMLP